MQSISCRMDLEPAYGSQYPFGAIDAKLSSIKSASRLHVKPEDVSGATAMNSAEKNVTKDKKNETPLSPFLPTIHTVLGPTHDQQPVFCWELFAERRDIRGKRFSYLGAPPCFDFDWIVFPPPKDYLSNLKAKENSYIY
jgi:hypothetical protein